MKQEYRITMGRRVKQLRAIHGISQEQLAKAIELQRSYVSAIERGVRKIPLEKLIMMCETYKVDMNFFSPIPKVDTEKEIESIKEDIAGIKKKINS